MSFLDEKIKELKQTGIDSDIVDHIRDHIDNSVPARLVKISPFRLAEEWNTAAYETLDAFLYGTRLGIFDLEWDVKCPSCKGSTQLSDHLSVLKPASHCQYCRIDISGGFDDAVEVTFRVNENVRRIGQIPFYEVISSNSVSENAQIFRAEPGETYEKKIELNRGTWHMHTPDCRVGAPLLIRGGAVNQDDPQVVEFVYDNGRLQRGTEFYGPGNFVVRLINRGDEAVEFEFARAKEFPWVSGAVVASSQIFRDMFSSELIASDESFSVKNISFVFTDIKGSTAMYERLGDSNAYYLVKEHFKIMKDVVARHHGSIVKTIGDAIMASFLVSSDAVGAVFDMYEAFNKFNYANQEKDDIIIKVGVHRGPCLAVTSNDKLDYFGRTVNIAARVQGLSQGGDMVISDKVYQEADIKSVVDGCGWTLKPDKAYLKGIADLYDVVYLYPNAS